MISVLIGACILTFSQIDDYTLALIKGGACLAADVISYNMFVRIQYRYIQGFISEQPGIWMSDYTRKKVQHTAIFSRMLYFIMWCVCIISGFIVVSIGSKDRMLSDSMVITQIVFFMIMLAYKGYYLDLITVFADQEYMTGLNVIRYDKIDEIVERQRVTGLQDMVVFADMFHAGKKVGYDRLTLTDYQYLCQRIGSGGYK